MYGCSGSFRGIDGSYPTPPNDVVIVGKSRREFYDQQGNQKEGKLGNVYFHFNTDCVRMKNPFFIPFLSRLQGGVLNYLLPIHKQLLNNRGITVQDLTVLKGAGIRNVNKLLLKRQFF